MPTECSVNGCRFYGAGEGSPPGQTVYVRAYDLTAALLKAEYTPEPQGAYLFLCSALVLVN
jgi:hypothetical protein